jgi:hypothetical protein
MIELEIFRDDLFLYFHFAMVIGVIPDAVHPDNLGIEFRGRRFVGWDFSLRFRF